MNNELDELTKRLTQSVTRRAALKRFCVGLAGMVLGTVVFVSFAQAAPSAPPAQTSSSIPWSQMGAKAGADYKGDGLTISATETGARVHCVFQHLNGEATREGLWLTSTGPGQPHDRFRVVAAAIRNNRLAQSGTVMVTEKMARFTRPGLVEEYTVSMDGVRQDFVVLEKPGSSGPKPAQTKSPQSNILENLSRLTSAATDEGALRLELAVTGARVEQTASGAQLVLDNSKHKIAYSRLKVTDANGKELPARMEAGSKSEIRNPKSEMGLAVLVDDTDAVYPVRIDPTFSDANWISMGGIPGANDTVNAAVVDGSGNLYIGGEFTLVGDVIASGIGKWDGNDWSAVGSGLYGDVYALAASDSDVYAGGYFDQAGGSAGNYIAKWNGSTWSALGSGMDDEVLALAVSGSDVYVGGRFTTAGGTPANYIAKWNGGTWSALGSGMDDLVYALAVSGSDVYVGGRFTTAGGTPANYIAKWNGSSWSTLGSGMSFWVDALAVSGSDVYAGGTFTTAGGTPANYIAKWNGSSWSALGSGMNTWVYALAVSGGDLYVGGDFTSAGGTPAEGIAKWNGSSWSALGSGVDVAHVAALAVSGGDLYAGGDFTTAGGKVSTYLSRAVLGDAPGYNQLTGTLLSGGDMQFSYIGYPATNYALDRAFNLAPPISWVGQQTNTMTVSGVLMFTNTPVASTNNFWRVRSLP